MIAAGYAHAKSHGYEYCGRVDADGQHPARELSRLLELVRAGTCDVAVGSRFVTGHGYEPNRYVPSAARKLGIGVLSRAMELRLGRPFGDATSGCTPSTPRHSNTSRSPTRAARQRWRLSSGLSDAGLRVDEVPVDMRERASGESKLRGKKAVKLVFTVTAALLAAEGLRRVIARHRRR